ncbi:IS66 family insertion sequence element accessory protein TnpB [Ligilactobacillus acidipiscis]|uniref:Uncharacterized protein n=1 Tax=Ligilactobacillus acidipiscis TaxID=89059 RepID=A0A1W7QM39_9LACO|nr:IS66 family insertion sequence element accessory protein TnpB [Ligilactobacillus acidipiscis]GAW65046.1 transposase [Ligilactobacillus acidipiscis]SPO49446.1 hypothetical protein PLAC02_P40 [Ligilactobacillus acidipiscis]
MIVDMKQLHGIYLVCGRTDLRRGIDGLATVVSQQYSLDPYSKSLFRKRIHSSLGYQTPLQVEIATLTSQMAA